MATRAGSFGKLPKAAPDLSATIAALLSEYMSQVDQNMVDAWRNGGEVDGKPVTDARLLKHFKMRRNELDPKDPEYQQWDNRITQYEFSIEESKMAVKWDNGQASESEMAAFYRRWEKKTPDNTEFDRTLRKSFGQWSQSANGRASGSNAAAEAAAHNRWAAKTYTDHVKPADTANAWLSGMLFNWGYLPGSKQDGKEMPPGNIAGLEANSDMDFETLLSVMGQGGLTPEQQADVESFVTGMKKIDPAFEMTPAWFNKANDTAQLAIKDLKKKSTSQTEANQWGDVGSNIRTTVNRINAAPAVEDLKAAREQFELEMGNSAGNPALQEAAMTKYLGTLETVQGALDAPGSFKNPNRYDTGIVPGVNAEIDMLRRGLEGKPITGTAAPTWMDSTSGLAGQSGEDANSWGPLLNTFNENRDVIINGGYAVVGTDAEGNPAFVYQPGDVPPPAGYRLVDGAGTAGAGVPVYVQAQPIQFAPVAGVNGVRTGAMPVAVDAFGNYRKEDGSTTLNPEEAAPASDIGFWKVSIPNPGGAKDTEWYEVDLPGGGVIKTLDPPLLPGVKVEERSADAQGGGKTTIMTIDLGPGGEGVKTYSIRDYLTFGPSKGPGSDPRPESPFQIDPVTNKPTKKPMPGWYTTEAGVAAAAELSTLDVDDPDYRDNRAAILNATKSVADAARQQAFFLGERGDDLGAKSLLERADSLDADFTNLMVLVTAQANGDVSSLGQKKMAETLVMTNATWDGKNVIPGAEPPKGSTASATQLVEARTWALTELDKYDERTRKPAGMAYGGSPGGGSTVFGSATDPAFRSLREQISKTENPRQLKLPSGITDGVNPFIPADVKTPQVQVNVRAGTIGVPSPVGAGSRVPGVQPPTSSIPQPPAASPASQFNFPTPTKPYVPPKPKTFYSPAPFSRPGSAPKPF